MKLKAFFTVFLLFFCQSNADTALGYTSASTIWDREGVSLTEAFEKVYRDIIDVKDGRCYFQEKQAKGDDIEYELEKCQLRYTLLKKLSKAERKDSVELKGTIWVEGTSFRTRTPGGVWSKEKTSKHLQGKPWRKRTGYEFKLRKGKFEFLPTEGASKLRRNNSYIDKLPKIWNEWKVVFYMSLPFLFIVLLVLRGIRRRSSIGTYGEQYTAARVRAISNGIVFRDVYVSGTHDVQQIDLVAVTVKGVLVIEKKTYSGMVIGRAYDKVWKVYYNGREMYTMMNPHHQNYGHIQAILERFPELKNKIVDLVIFGDYAILGDKIPRNTIRDCDFEYYYRCLPRLLNEDEIRAIAYDIEALNNERPTLKTLHGEKIKRKNGYW